MAGLRSQWGGGVRAIRKYWEGEMRREEVHGWVVRRTGGLLFSLILEKPIHALVQRPGELCHSGSWR